MHFIVKAESQENFLGNFSCHFILLREVEDSTIEIKTVVWKSIKVSKKILILHHCYYYRNKCHEDFDCILSYYRILNVKKVLNKICAIGILFYINLKYYDAIKNLMQLKIIKISCTIFTATSVIILFYYIKFNYIFKLIKLYIYIKFKNCHKIFSMSNCILHYLENLYAILIAINLVSYAIAKSTIS